MVQCPNCGKEMEDKPFCSACGTKVAEQKICPKCNAKIDDDESLFCPDCGQKLDEEIDSNKEIEEDAGDDENSQEIEEDIEETSEDSKEKTSENTINCPHCNTEIDDSGIIYCPECGKAIEIDKNSLEGIKYTIKLKELIIFSIVSIVFSAFISLIFSFLFSSMGLTDLYPIGFIISLVIFVAIFGSFKDLLNGGLLGIITGLVLGLVSNSIILVSNGFQYNYVMLFGYTPIILTIIGLIVGVLSSVYLREKISKIIDIENTF